MYVGGEFYSDDRWLVETPQIDTTGMTFLNGGKACLIVIADYLLARGVKRILLPAYLCPTIVDTLEECGLTCAYYLVNRDLSIDLNDLQEKTAGHRAILYINYFGFQHSPAVIDFMRYQQSQGVFIVEDNAQAGFTTKNTGDFVFNSLRKLVPHDGGYLFARHDISGWTAVHGQQVNRRLPLIRAYRQRLVDYLYRGEGTYNEVRELYDQAEHYYEKDRVVEGDALEQWHIEHLDWAGIKRKRRQNYDYLVDAIRGIDEVTPFSPSLQPDNLPLGLPVIVTGISRDQLFDDLGNAGIGLTIHWAKLATDTRLNRNKVAAKLAGSELTLVIDQRISHKQLDFLVLNLKECIALQKPIYFQGKQF